MSVRERCGETETIFRLALANGIRQQRQYFFCCRNRVIDAGAQDREKNCFRIGRADTRGIKLVGNECFDMAAPAIPIAEKAIVHEQPFSAGEWMAICAGNCSAGCGADVSEKQVRLQMAAQVAQILIRPSRPDLAIQARFGMLAVPAEPESIAIDAGGRFHRVNALRNQGMSRLGDVVFERRRFTAIGDPATHGTAFCYRSGATPAMWHLGSNESRCARQYPRLGPYFLQKYVIGRLPKCRSR